MIFGHFHFIFIGCPRTITSYLSPRAWSPSKFYIPWRGTLHITLSTKKWPLEVHAPRGGSWACPELTQLYLKCSALVIGISWVGVSPLSSLSKLNLMRMAIVFINTIQQILAQYITFVFFYLPVFWT